MDPESGAVVKGPVSKRRPLKSPTRREVPESVLSPHGEGQPGLTSLVPDINCALGDWEIQEDIGTLLDKGKTDEQILAELELPPTLLSTIQYLRGRNKDGL